MKTCDSGIAATFLRECRFGFRDRNPVVDPIEYVGDLEEIIQLNCNVFCQVVFIGTWVKASYRGANATVKKDQWGFTVANFDRMITFGRDSFAFPSQVEQVFFSDYLESPRSKVLVRTEPRERGSWRLLRTWMVDSCSNMAGTMSTQVSEPPILFRRTLLRLTAAGRMIRLLEIVDDEIPDELGTFDADMGGSSEED